LAGLRAWAYEYDDKSKIFSSIPKHDWASHDGDGFSYGCLIMQQFNPVKPEDNDPKFWEQQTLNELWNDKRPDRRI
jgi:hypothetical protein